MLAGRYTTPKAARRRMPARPNSRVERVATPKVALWGGFNAGIFTRYDAFVKKQLNPYIVQNFRIPETDAVIAGLTDIDPQSNSWSCGINGSARFLAMLGNPLKDYGRYHNEAPRHHLAHVETGPGTLWLLRHMERDGQTQGLQVHSHMTNDWASQKPVIDASLAAGRPVLVLIELSGRKLHWINLIGRAFDTSGRYVGIDVNGDFITMAESDLRQRMNLDDHSVHKLPVRDDRIACFNSILAEVGPLRDTAGNIERRDNKGAQLDENQNQALNVLESLGEAGMDALDAVADGAKAVGNAVEDGAKAVGNAVEDGAKGVGNGVETGVKAVGNGIETGAKAVGNAAESAAKAVASIFRGWF